MFKISLADVEKSFLLLLHHLRFIQAANLLEQALKHLQTASQYAVLLELMQKIPLEQRLKLHPCRRMYMQLLSLNKLEPELLGFLEQTKNLCSPSEYAELELEYVGFLTMHSRFSDMKARLEPLLLRLHNENLGRAYTWLGWALFELQLPEWQASFQKGLPLLKNIGLARGLINYGYCLSEAGLSAKAQSVWQEALPLVKHRAQTTAHILYNLGVDAQRHFLPQAEGYFLELERVSRNPSAATHRASAWNGIALSRRVRGQWSRAEAAYKKALSQAQGSFERTNAYRGLARVYLLSGRANQALKILEDAFHQDQLEQDSLWLTKAQVLLAVHSPQEVSHTLAQISNPQKESVRWSVALLQGELARQAGNPDLAKALLVGLPLESLAAREEALRFPELLALLPQKPVPLVYQTDLVVRVETQDSLLVQVNDVPIMLSHKMTELLVFLLEHQGFCSMTQICAALYQGLDLQKAKRRLSVLVQMLRQMLGWQASLQANHGAYRLDSNAVWQYERHNKA